MSKSPEFPTILLVTGWATAATVAAFVIVTTGHRPGEPVGVPMAAVRAETPAAPAAEVIAEAESDAAPAKATPEPITAEIILAQAAAVTDPIPAPVAAEPQLAAAPSTPLGLGRTALTEEISAWDVTVLPDGTGLPVGSGDVETGDEVFAANCASCHGDFAEGLDSWPVLAGGDNSLTDPRPVKTVGSYWPYLSTVFDYVHRSMPFGGAQTLTPDDTYAITAFLLYSNGIVEDDFVLTHENFTSIVMPNVDGFYEDDRPQTEYPLFTGAPCMENCLPAAPQVTKRAIDLKVTPTGEDGKPAGTLPVLGADAGDAAVTPATSEAPAGAIAEAPAAEPEAEAAAQAAQPAVAPEPILSAAADQALIAAGEAVFKKCSACHKVGEGAKNAVGPTLNGIVGNAAGAVAGFNYSKPLLSMAEGGLVWDAENLQAFLENPRSFMKGTKMAFAGLKSADERNAVIAYLASLGG
ncbi:MAG: c-type cytochrome [Pseudotabrizicola sp.]|uniref:c-type cytochrome n=1 Tax=Pseudotabrizicola sp. TaxID=2939647 RepID=UPI002724E100|nr:c-type cytochrome [Pseudotabrizicola sp.]MDO9638040.1 c-type cytochrome [Pseudotabrizicola sp.]